MGRRAPLRKSSGKAKQCLFQVGCKNATKKCGELKMSQSAIKKLTSVYCRSSNDSWLAGALEGGRSTLMRLRPHKQYTPVTGLSRRKPFAGLNNTDAVNSDSSKLTESASMRQSGKGTQSSQRVHIPESSQVVRVVQEEFAELPTGMTAEKREEFASERIMPPKKGKSSSLGQNSHRSGNSSRRKPPVNFIHQSASQRQQPPSYSRLLQAMSTKQPSALQRMNVMSLRPGKRYASVFVRRQKRKASKEAEKKANVTCSIEDTTDNLQSSKYGEIEESMFQSTKVQIGKHLVHEADVHKVSRCAGNGATANQNFTVGKSPIKNSPKNGSKCAEMLPRYSRSSHEPHGERSDKAKHLQRTEMLLRPNKKYVSVFRKTHRRSAPTHTCLPSETIRTVGLRDRRHSFVDVKSFQSVDQHTPAGHHHADSDEVKSTSAEKVDQKLAENSTNASRGAGTCPCEISDDNSASVAIRANGLGLSQQKRTKGRSLQELLYLGQTRNIVTRHKSSERFTRKAYYSRMLQSTKDIFGKPPMLLRPNRKYTSVLLKRPKNHSSLQTQVLNTDGQIIQCNSSSTPEMQGALMTSEYQGNQPGLQEKSESSTASVPLSAEEQCTAIPSPVSEHSNNGPACAMQSKGNTRSASPEIKQSLQIRRRSRLRDKMESSSKHQRYSTEKASTGTQESRSDVLDSKKQHSVVPAGVPGELKSSPESMESVSRCNCASEASSVLSKKDLVNTCQSVPCIQDISTHSQNSSIETSGFALKAVMTLRPYTRYRSIAGKPHLCISDCKHWLLIQGGCHSSQLKGNPNEMPTSENQEEVSELLVVQEEGDIKSNLEVPDLLGDVPSLTQCREVPVSFHTVKSQVVSEYAPKILMMLQPYTRYRGIFGKPRLCITETEHWLLAQGVCASSPEKDSHEVQMTSSENQENASGELFVGQQKGAHEEGKPPPEHVLNEDNTKELLNEPLKSSNGQTDSKLAGESPQETTCMQREEFVNSPAVTAESSDHHANEPAQQAVQSQGLKTPAEKMSAPQFRKTATFKSKTVLTGETCQTAVQAKTTGKRSRSQHTKSVRSSRLQNDESKLGKVSESKLRKVSESKLRKVSESTDLNSGTHPQTCQKAQRVERGNMPTEKSPGHSVSVTVGSQPEESRESVRVETPASDNQEKVPGEQNNAQEESEVNSHQKVPCVQDTAPSPTSDVVMNRASDQTQSHEVSDYAPKTLMMLRPYAAYQTIAGKSQLHISQNGIGHWLLAQAQEGSIRQRKGDVSEDPWDDDEPSGYLGIVYNTRSSKTNPSVPSNADSEGEPPVKAEHPKRILKPTEKSLELQLQRAVKYGGYATEAPLKVDKTDRFGKTTEKSPKPKLRKKGKAMCHLTTETHQKAVQAKKAHVAVLPCDVNVDNTPQKTSHEEGDFDEQPLVSKKSLSIASLQVMQRQRRSCRSVFASSHQGTLANQQLAKSCLEDEMVTPVHSKKSEGSLHRNPEGVSSSVQLQVASSKGLSSCFKPCIKGSADEKVTLAKQNRLHRVCLDIQVRGLSHLQHLINSVNADLKLPSVLPEVTTVEEDMASEKSCTDSAVVMDPKSQAMDTTESDSINETSGDRDVAISLPCQSPPEPQPNLSPVQEDCSKMTGELPHRTPPEQGQSSETERDEHDMPKDKSSCHSSSEKGRNSKCEPEDYSSFEDRPALQASVEKESNTNPPPRECNVTKAIKPSRRTAMKLRKKDKHFLFSRLGFKKARQRAFHESNAVFKQNSVKIRTCLEKRRASRGRSECTKCLYQCSAEMPQPIQGESFAPALGTHRLRNQHDISKHMHELCTAASQKLSPIDDPNAILPSTRGRPRKHTQSVDVNSTPRNCNLSFEHRSKEDFCLVQQTSIDDPNTSLPRTRGRPKKQKQNVNENSTPGNCIIPPEHSNKEELPLPQQTSIDDPITILPSTRGRCRKRKQCVDKYSIPGNIILSPERQSKEELPLPQQTPIDDPNTILPSTRGRPRKHKQSVDVNSTPRNCNLSFEHRSKEDFRLVQQTSIDDPNTSLPRTRGRPKKHKQSVDENSTPRNIILPPEHRSKEEFPLPQQTSIDEPFAILPSTRGRWRKHKQCVDKYSIPGNIILSPEKWSKDEFPLLQQTSIDDPHIFPRTRGKQTKRKRRVDENLTSRNCILPPACSSEGELALPQQTPNSNPSLQRSHKKECSSVQLERLQETRVENSEPWSQPDETRRKKSSRLGKQSDHKLARRKQTSHAPPAGMLSSTPEQLPLSKRIQQLIPGYASPDKEEFTLEEFCSLETLEEAVEMAAREARSEEHESHQNTGTVKKIKSKNSKSHLTPSSSNKKSRSKRSSRSPEGSYWDCSVCTYRNKAEAFKCAMCDVRKGTSTRKPRLNAQLVAQQQAQQSLSPLIHVKPVKTMPRGPAQRKAGAPKKPRPRLKNVDRSSAISTEVVVNNVPVIITEYKEKSHTRTTVDSDEASADRTNGNVNGL